MVFYRKYRPQTISDLDSGTLRETLTAVLSRSEIPHAFLLTGPKGLGKTSTARIIAKVVNCEHNGKKLENLPSSKIEPDNTCDQCVSITNGSNLDVLEIDGASNRGIDEIRDLRDKVKLAPSRARKKVYIIDEVHMLTTEAFNALLKTIEEPPMHVMFIFCTTEPQKVPGTIMSRCLHVPYTLATEADLVRSFKRIVDGEKIDIEEDALHIIAKLADGSFRDGTKILEELVVLSNGQKITQALVEEKYKVSSISYFVSGLLDSLQEKDVKKGLGIISEIVEQGIEVKYFLSQVLVFLHEQLLSAVGISKNTKYPTSAKYSLNDIQQLVALLSEAYRETKYAVIPQLPLELAVVAWSCLPVAENEFASNVGQIQRGDTELNLDPISHKDGKHTIDSLLKKEKNLKVQSILRGENTPKEPVKPKTNEGQEILSDKAAGEQFMENLIYKVKPQNFSVAGVLRGCVVKKLADGEVIFQTSYKFHKEKLDEGKIREILEKAIKEITGKTLKVMIELKG